ncbi:hypothetical protein Tco_0126100, partial [Tanacetum coccineum]
LTEAEEEVVAREVHATHARIVYGPDPKPMQEDQTGSNSGELHVSLAGPNPEHMDDEFLEIAYPKVHENLKLITDEHVVIIRNHKLTRMIWRSGRIEQMFSHIIREKGKRWEEVCV